jgi:SAM-dependent methyltransferase
VTCTYIAPWYQNVYGKYGLELEKTLVAQCLSQLSAQYLLQIGDPFLSSLSDDSKARQRIFLEPTRSSSSFIKPPLAFCQGFAETLPFEGTSLDVVFLAHALEVVSNPKKTLEEIYRVLVPEGYLLVTGFQPALLWGLYQKKYFKPQRQRASVGLSVLRSWLLEYDFEIISGKLFCFTPFILGLLGIQSPFLEKIGPFSCPFLGSMYLLLVQKRCVTLTPLKPSWKRIQLLQGEWAGEATKWSFKNDRKNEG